jgi:hypothetical protein
MQAPVKIRPPKLKLIMLVGAGALLALGCAFLLINGHKATDRLTGLLGVVFFGSLSAILVYITLKRSWSFALNDAGIEINNLKYKASFVPWRDVEAVGLATILDKKMVGIRLASYDAFLASRGLSPSQDHPANRVIWLSRIAGFVNMARLIPDDNVIKYANDLNEMHETGEALKPYSDAKDATDLLKTNRATCGYDLAFAWSDIDRRPQAMVELIYERWQAALHRSEAN